MNAEFFEALALLEKEKGISVEYLCEKIENAIAIAIRRDYVGTEDVKVVIDPETRTFDVAIRKLVVEEACDPRRVASLTSRCVCVCVCVCKKTARQPEMVTFWPS